MTLNALTPDHIAHLATLLPEDRFAPAEARYLEEPRGRWAGSETRVARPKSSEEVAVLVRAAVQMQVGIVPYAGGTGLVGGQVAQDGPAPLILSVEHLNTIDAVRPEENVLTCGAGAILADVQEAAAQANRLFPLSLASEGSARIGGLLATNAGGTGVLRYGNARDLCLGVEAVLADGQLYQGLSRLRKDNTGYDLRHLLLGSEGTLGIITAATLKLFPRPRHIGAALLAVPDPKAALSLLALARDHVGDAINAFELIHRQGFDFIAETGLPIRNPWPDTPQWCVLLELGLSSGPSPEQVLEDLFEAAVTAGLCHDGLVAQTEDQRAGFWAVRENIPEANRQIGSVSNHDISVPLGAISDFIDQANARIADLGEFRCNCFGHVGDGNLHFNVFPMPGKTRADHLAERDDIKRIVHDITHALGGSVSAEHGVGRLKVDDLERYSDPTKLNAMRAIKHALDPKGILNPGAVLRRSSSL